MRVNSRVKHTQVHASACILASVERVGSVWDVAFRRYRNYTLYSCNCIVMYLDRNSFSLFICRPINTDNQINIRTSTAILTHISNI